MFFTRGVRNRGPQSFPTTPSGYNIYYFWDFDNKVASITKKNNIRQFLELKVLTNLALLILLMNSEVPGKPGRKLNNTPHIFCHDHDRKDVFFTTQCPVDETVDFNKEDGKFQLTLLAFSFASAEAKSAFFHCKLTGKYTLLL